MALAMEAWQVGGLIVAAVSASGRGFSNCAATAPDGPPQQSSMPPKETAQRRERGRLGAMPGAAGILLVVGLQAAGRH